MDVGIAAHESSNACGDGGGHGAARGNGYQLIEKSSSRKIAKTQILLGNCRKILGPESPFRWNQKTSVLLYEQLRTIRGALVAMPLPTGRQPAPVVFHSAHAPLLHQLHERLNDFEQSIAYAQSIYGKYGLPVSARRLAPDRELKQRMQRTADAFNAMLEHVEAVDAFVEREYVVLTRARCGAANSLFSVSGVDDEAGIEERRRMVKTSSRILANSCKLKFAFPPRPSYEVLIRSPILANSHEVRLLSTPPELLGLC
jgi:hypothetical protein